PIAMIPFGVTDANGAFDLSGAVSGSYLVRSDNFRTLTLPPMTLPPNGPNNQPLPNPPLSGQVRVDMGNVDIENLRLAATPPSNLSGRVLIDGGASPDLTKIQVTLTWDPDVIGMPNTGTFGGPAANTRVQADGGFRLAAAAGNYRLSVGG